MKKKEGFYKDLDRSKNKKGSCNCLSLAIVFILILFIAEFLLFSFSAKWKSDPTQDLSFSAPSSFETSISQSEISPGNLRVTIGQGQLCKILEDGGVSADGLMCVIDPEAIKITGKISSFLPSNVSLNLLPKAQNEKIAVELKSVLVGKISLPPSLFKVFTGKIEDLVNSNEAIKNINIEKIDLQEGMMAIEGTKK